MVFVFEKRAYGGGKGPTTMQTVRYSLLLMAGLCAYALVGAVAFLYISPEFESQQNLLVPQETSFRDALYWSTITITTVGYGDVVPFTTGGKLFVSIFILASMVMLGLVLDLTDFLFSFDVEELEEGDEEETKKWLSRSKRRLYINLFMLLALMLCSGAFFMVVEDFSAVDSFYVTVVTLSTVGYGDLTPQTSGGRVFAIFWVGLSVIMGFRIVGALMDVVLEQRKIKWRNKREERQNVIRQHLSARVGIIGMQNITETEAVQKYRKQDLIEVLNKMEFVVARLVKNGDVDPKTLRALDAEFKAQTPESIAEEFASEETGKIFANIIGNVEP